MENTMSYIKKFIKLAIVTTLLVLCLSVPTALAGGNSMYLETSFDTTIKIEFSAELFDAFEAVKRQANYEILKAKWQVEKAQEQLEGQLYKLERKLDNLLLVNKVRDGFVIRIRF
jgi:hypothetical protein